MARPATNHEIKKAAIVEVALKVFARYGYAGTTNKLIAEAARQVEGANGISPALIYHYFPDGKAQLFAECIQQFPPLQEFAHTLQENVQQPPELFLGTIAYTYNNFLKTDEVLAIARLVFLDGANQPEVPNVVFDQFVPNLFMPMLEYFTEQSREGKIRNMTADQIIMQIIGPLVVRRLMLANLPVERLPIKLSNDEEFIESLVQTLVGGILK